MIASKEVRRNSKPKRALSRHFFHSEVLMRSKLLSTVAILAFFVSGTLAFSQERGPTAPGAEKSAPAEKSQVAPSRAAEPKSSAQGGGESSKERLPAGERTPPARSATEPRSAGETKGNEPKPTGTRATESKPSEQKPNEPRRSETTKPGDAKPVEHKSEQRTGESKPSTSSGEKTNAASEPKAPANSRGQSEPAKSNAESTSGQRNEQNRTATPNAPGASSTGNARPSPTGSAAPTGNAGTSQPGAGSPNKTGTAAPAGTQANVNASANIEPQQQSKIVETLKTRHSDAVTNVNFSVTVGATVPETVHYRPLPEDIVSIVPQYRGYHFVMVRDEVVIIEPRTRKIVTVIHEGGSSGASVRRNSLNMPVEKRRKIKTEVIRSYHGPRDARFDLRVGERVPDTITLETFPEAIYTEDPDLKTYEYVVVQERVVLVDPQSREIVEILD